MIELTTRLPAPAEAVWAHAVTEQGINDELRPILRMTMPEPLRGATVDSVETGVELGRSWILLGGLIPVDYDDLCLAEIEPGRRFQERSRMAALRVWTHERVVEPAGEEACTITDRLGWEPRPLIARLPGSERVIASIVGALFRHRHRRLERRWGAGA